MYAIEKEGIVKHHRIQAPVPRALVPDEDIRTRSGNERRTGGTLHLPVNKLDVKRLTEIQAQTLTLLVEDGPLQTDILPSFPAAIFLARAGWAVDILVSGEIGFYAATQEGMFAYCKLLEVDSVAEGRLKRHSVHDIQKK